MVDRLAREFAREGADDFESQVQLFNVMLRSGELELAQLEILAVLSDPVALTLITRPIERPLNFRRQDQEAQQWLRRIQLEGSEPWWLDMAIAITRLAVLDDLDNSVNYKNMPKTPENDLALQDYERVAGQFGRRAVRVGGPLLSLLRRKVTRVNDAFPALIAWHDLAGLLINEADPKTDFTARRASARLGAIMRSVYSLLSVSPDRPAGYGGRALQAWLRRGVRETCREWWGLPEGLA